jgi:hypothetical protein
MNGFPRADPGTPPRIHSARRGTIQKRTTEDLCTPGLVGSDPRNSTGTQSHHTLSLFNHSAFLPSVLTPPFILSYPSHLAFLTLHTHTRQLLLLQVQQARSPFPHLEKEEEKTRFRTRCQGTLSTGRAQTTLSFTTPHPLSKPKDSSAPSSVSLSVISTQRFD